MTVKGFFKSTTFKCIIALLCVLLVSGIFLTIMNSLLAVTDEERFARAINKIYGKSVKTESIAVADYNDNASIDEAYRIKDDGNYLIKATGFGGYDSGTVTCWIVVNVSGGSVNGIDKVVIDSNKGQSYIDRVGSKALDQFTELYEDGIIYTPGLITGATVTGTKNAICNAVNAALDFVNAKFGNVETEAQKLLKNIAALYGDVEVNVYGVGEDGNEKLIEATDETLNSFVSAPVTLGNAIIHSLYKVRYIDGENEVLHYVVSSTGLGGFENGNGTVTTLTSLVVENGAIAGVNNVVITGNVGQSYIDKVTHLDKYHDAEYSEGLIFNFISSGATWSSAATNNAVNGALRYVEANIAKLGDLPENEEGENTPSDSETDSEGGNE